MKTAKVRGVSWEMEDDVYEWHTRKDSVEIGPESCWEWHPTIGQELESFVYYCKLKEPKVFIDIGCHCGIFSSVYCSTVKNHSCHSIEPIKLHTDRLSRTAKLNNWNLKTHNIGLNNYIGESHYHNVHMAMFVEDPNYNVPNEYINGNSDNSIVNKVTIDTLDNFISRNQIVPNLIKIDIEGYEISVLEKGQDCLNRYNIDLFFEFHRNESINLGSNTSKLIDYIPSNKYNFYTFDFKYEILDLFDYINNHESNMRFIAINKNNSII